MQASPSLIGDSLELRADEDVREKRKVPQANIKIIPQQFYFAYIGFTDLAEWMNPRRTKDFPLDAMNTLTELTSKS